MPGVLVIVPAYNEEASIGNVLRTLRAQAPDVDVVVVDDGSTDNTAEVVRSVHGVELITLPYNMGIGDAMQTGYRYACQEGYDISVQCDADGQHPVDELQTLVRAIEVGRADLVVGSRYVADTGYKPTFSRRVGKSLLSRLVNSAIGGGITDTTSGFRAMNRAAFETFAHTYPDDYPEAEALVILHKHGLRAVEVPVEMRPRQGGRSSIGMARAAYYIVKVSLAIFVGVFKKISFSPQRGDDVVRPAEIRALLKGLE
jgi:glycosyltransferase involved in cell wall biosynthesis